MFVAQIVGAIVALGAVGVASWSTWLTVAGTSAYSESVRNALGLEEAASALAAAAISNGGAISLPAPSSEGGIPEWVTAKAVTPWGTAYRYCPYGTGVGGTSSAINGYNVGTTTLAGRGYVVSSDAPSVPGTAFVIISGKPGGVVPGCSEVTLAAGEWSVPDGRARGYTVSALRGFRTASGEMYVAPSAAGSGLSASDPASLSDAFAWWQASRPQSMRFLLSPGTYNLPASVSGWVGGEVAFEASGVAVLNGDLSMPSDVRLSGVSISGNLTVRQGTDAFVEGGSFGGLVVYGEATVSGAASVTALAAAAGGRVSLSSASVSSVVAATGGTATFASSSASSLSASANSGGTVTAAGGATLGTVTAGVGGTVCVETAGAWSCVEG